MPRLSNEAINSRVKIAMSPPIQPVIQSKMSDQTFQSLIQKARDKRNGTPAGKAATPVSPQVEENDIATHFARMDNSSGHSMGWVNPLDMRFAKMKQELIEELAAMIPQERPKPKGKKVRKSVERDKDGRIVGITEEEE